MSSAARIEELQKKFDENPRRYFAPLANECRKAGDLDAAIAICRAHLPQQPGHMSGHIVYGQALFEAGELDEARSVFETALGLDPENLIALRHMGDISLRAGDVEGARSWYTRVLETDPRNEEIQGLLAGLQAEAPQGAAAPGPVAEPPSAGSPADEAVPPAGGEPERDLPAFMEPALVAAAAESLPEEPALLDFEPTSFEPPVASSDAPPAVDAAPPVEANEAPSFTEALTLDGFEATSFEPPSGAIQRDESLEPLVPERAPEAVPDLPPLDLDASGFGATGLEPTSLAIPTPPPQSDAFVTETMAELYLQQGYPDRALDVYRQLIAQNPDDAGLRERMARVEREGRSAAADAFATEEVGADEPVEAFEPITTDEPTLPGLPVAMEPALVAAAAEATGPGTQAPRGPTIREVLVALATGQPVPAGESAVVAEVQAAPPVGGEVAEVIDVADELPATAGLDVLFGPVRSDSDLRAADSLAEAFTAPAPAAPAEPDSAEPNPLTGRPARPAGSDLSLDHVFGQPRQHGGARPTGSFSFDQFFSEDAVRTPREEPAEPARDAGSEDDIEQFNAWLKGLKGP